MYTIVSFPDTKAALKIIKESTASIDIWESLIDMKHDLRGLSSVVYAISAYIMFVVRDLWSVKMDDKYIEFH